VLVDGEPVELPDRELAVLRILAERPGAAVAKATLLRRIWGAGNADEHAVEVTVARLRRRLGPVGAAIETAVRRGYRLVTDEPASTPSSGRGERATSTMPRLTRTGHEVTGGRPASRQRPVRRS
jgi:DNA-binding winged helix-turn-helix (wHTH) protein